MRVKNAYKKIAKGRFFYYNYPYPILYINAF